MTTANLSILNDLIEMLKDAEKGFSVAAEKVTPDGLKTLLGEFSLQRGKFAGELQALAHHFGEDQPPPSGTVGGAVHRGWLDLKAALTGGSESAILAECERGEDAGLAMYNKAFEEEELSPEIEPTLRKQYVDIEEAYFQLRRLRELAEKS